MLVSSWDSVRLVGVVFLEIGTCVMQLGQPQALYRTTVIHTLRVLQGRECRLTEVLNKLMRLGDEARPRYVYCALPFHRLL